MKISTNKEIRKGYLCNNLKAKNVICFLITQGFTTKKEIEKTALSELDFEGKKIKNVSLNSDYIIINFKK
jgi:hypothetical protein